jgi:Kef-type K+ transport system membrane component KefB
MESTLGFLLVLAIVILCAKAAGYVSTRMHQPAVLGEMLAGVALGPTLLDLFRLEPFAHGHLEETTFYLAEAGVIFLMFMAGIETEVEEMTQLGRPAILIGILGVAVPFVLGWGVALGFGYPAQNAIFIGLTLTATSVSISAQTMMELGILRSREGVALLAAAVVDDVIVILLLSTYIALVGEGGGGAATIVGTGLRMVVYLALAVAVGTLALGRVARRVADLPISEGLIALVIVVTLFYAWSAEALGRMSAITGAFVAGLLFARTTLKTKIREGMHTITYALLVPIFFVSVGLRANARALQGEILWFALAILVVAVAGKLIGGGLGARLTGFSTPEAVRIGIGMVSRGEVGLIVAAVGLNNGLLSNSVFAVVVVVVVVTTLLTPIMLRASYRKRTQP